MLALLIAAALQQAAPAPQPSAPGPAGSGLDLSDRRHLRALYLDLVGRTPTPDEIEAADPEGAAPETLVRHLLGQREFWEHWYEDELFYFLLVDNARPDDVAGPAGIPWRLSAGQLDLPGAVTEIVSGAAFNRANPGPDTFVSVVLEQLLGVDVQRQPALLEAGKKMYDGKPATLYGEDGDSQADVVRIAARQPAFLRQIVERQHRRLVGGEATPRELEGWAAGLRERPGDFTALVRDWVLSPAYAERLGTLRRKTDTQFLRGLYVDLTGEPPEPADLRRLRAALGTVA
ncbi:MAG TPA: hypothetical protein VFD43_07595, partial [Planctomycetota bacterium]|nr:hypothetical protein [Planctomycetota bacterium]